MKFEWGRSRMRGAFAGAFGALALFVLAPSIANSEEPPMPTQTEAPAAAGFWGWLATTPQRYQSEVRLAKRVPVYAGDNSIAAFLGSLNVMTRQATAWIKAWIPGETGVEAAPQFADAKPVGPVPEEAVFHEPAPRADATTAESKKVEPAIRLSPTAEERKAQAAQDPALDAIVKPAAQSDKKEIVVADASGSAATETQKSREDRLKDEIARRRAETDRQINEGLKKLEEFDAARKAREASAAADADAKAKADADAKAAAELEAKAKAAADAKARIEAEERAKADAAAKAKAEAEAKAEADRLEKAEIAAALDEKPLSEADKKAIDDAVMATARELDRAEDPERADGTLPGSDTKTAAKTAPVKPEIITRIPENELKPARSFAFADTGGGRMDEPDPGVRDEPQARGRASGHSETRAATHHVPRAYADADDRFDEAEAEPPPPRRLKVASVASKKPVIRVKSAQKERAATKPRFVSLKVKREARSVKVRRSYAVRESRPRFVPVERRIVRDIDDGPYVVAAPPHQVICVPERRPRGLFVLDH